MPDLRSIATQTLPAAALAAAVGAAAIGLQVVGRLGALERALAPAPRSAEVAPATSALAALRRADEAALRGELRVAAGLYEESVAAGDATEADLVVARLGLARATARLGERERSAAALSAASTPPERIRLAARLLAWAELASSAQAWSDARRLLWSALALQDGPLDEVARRSLACALARIADADRQEAGLDLRQRQPVETPADAPAWSAQLAAVDSASTPLVAVTPGPRPVVTVRADRADALTLLRVVALKAGVTVAAPAFAPPAGVSVDLRERPVDEVLAILAGAIGLELADQQLVPLLPPVDAAGRAAARARAAAAYRLAIKQGGPEAARAQVELAEVARGADRHEEAAALYRVVTESRGAAPEVTNRALLGLARSEAALLRFARARDALFRLVGRAEAKAVAPDALLLVAETYLAEGRDADAEAALRHLLATFAEAPQAPLAQLRLARVLAARGAHQDALVAFQAAEGPGVDATEAATGAARALLALDRPQEAVTALTGLLARVEEARAASTYLLLAEADHLAGDHLAAWACLTHVAREHAATAEASEAERHLPRELTELGLLEEATDALDRAPGDDDAERRLLVASAWLETGDLARARLAARGQDRSPALALLLARCDLLQGDVAAATSRLTRLDPTGLDAEQRAARSRLAAEAALARGAVDEARAAWGASAPGGRP
jgi:hypothetical protein